MFVLCLALLFHADPVVVSLDDPEDADPLSISIRITEVRDLRQMASLDSQGIGVTSVGVFEARAPLRTVLSVRQEVENLCRKWIRPSSLALPTRLEILSLESWSKPQDGPDPYFAVAKLRLVSLDSSNPGVLLSPEARSERQGVVTAKDQAVMLAKAVKDAIALVRPDMKPVPQAAMPPAPQFDPWADPRKGAAKDSIGTRLKHSVVLYATPGWNTMTMGVRICQNLEPQLDWTHGYWAGMLVRAPWTSDDFTEVWSGELQGGMAWWKRLDDGRSNFAATTSLGGILGTERFREVEVASDGTRTQSGKKYWVYVGGETRAGMRWAEPLETGLLAEGGVQVSLRVPSSIAYFDVGLYFGAGWRF